MTVNNVKIVELDQEILIYSCRKNSDCIVI